MHVLRHVVAGVLWLLPLTVLAVTDVHRYDDMIYTTAWQYGLEPALVKAVVHCESGFNPLAQSPRGAQGLMQLMPATQTLLGISDAFDPQRNLAGGTRYLSMMRETFQGNVTLMLAAYNAGPQAVMSAGYTLPPYPETLQYVQCVLAARTQYAQAKPAWPLPGHRMLSRSTSATPTLSVYPAATTSRLHPGKRLILRLDAVNRGAHPGQGLVLLQYPEHLVSFMALTSPGHETVAQLSPAFSAGTPPPTATTTYRLLSSHWPTWGVGERRTAMIALVPTQSQDILLHVSVVFDALQRQGDGQRWSSFWRLPAYRSQR